MGTRPGIDAEEMMRRVAERVRSILSERSDIPLQLIQLDVDLLKDLGMDCLELTECLMAIEEEFDVAIEDDTGRNVFLSDVKTVGDLVQHVISVWETGRPKRPEWRGPTPAPLDFEFEAFSQLGGRLDHAVESDALFIRIEDGPSGCARYQRATDGMRCVRIPAAKTAIGSENVEADALPVHRARLSEFLIDSEAVSNLAYCRFLNSIRRVPRAIVEDWIGVRPGDNRITHVQLQKRWRTWEPAPGTRMQPVILVSWYGANAYSLWANGLDWRYYRADGTVPDALATNAEAAPETLSMLPTEAQWEYAARGPEGAPGTETPQSAQLGMHRIGNTYSKESIPTTPVSARLGMSPFGLYQVIGNVWEWCRDWYASDFYARPEARQDNPCNTTPSGIRCERGGSWVGPVELGHPSYRRGRNPEVRGRCLGFRCVSFPPVEPG